MSSSKDPSVNSTPAAVNCLTSVLILMLPQTMRLPRSSFTMGCWAMGGYWGVRLYRSWSRRWFKYLLTMAPSKAGGDLLARNSFTRRVWTMSIGKPPVSLTRLITQVPRRVLRNTWRRKNKHCTTRSSLKEEKKERKHTYKIHYIKLATTELGENNSKQSTAGIMSMENHATGISQLGCRVSWDLMGQV